MAAGFHLAQQARQFGGVAFELLVEPLDRALFVFGEQGALTGIEATEATVVKTTGPVRVHRRHPCSSPIETHIYPCVAGG